MKYQIDARSTSYLERFYEPKVTAYEFMKCFFAYLKKGEVDEIERDLVDFLRNQKEDSLEWESIDECAGILSYTLGKKQILRDIFMDSKTPVLDTS